MSDPVQKSSAKIVSPHPVTEKRKVPFRCAEGEYLHINEDGNKICLPDRPLGELMGSSMTCDPCDWGTGLIYPKDMELSEIEKRIEERKRQDQFKDASSSKLSELITGKAEYHCKTKMPYTEEEEVVRDVSIPAISNESADAQQIRLEKAARDLIKTIHGCFDVRFIRFVPAADEAMKANRGKTSSKERPDPCAPGGVLEHQQVCRK